MNIQWYPGHMTKARRMMQEDIKLIDIDRTGRCKTAAGQQESGY